MRHLPKSFEPFQQGSIENAVLKQQNAILQRQVKRLNSSLQDMEFRFGISLANLRGGDHATPVEFEDQFQVCLLQKVTPKQDDPEVRSLQNLSFLRLKSASRHWNLASPRLLRRYLDEDFSDKSRSIGVHIDEPAHNVTSK